MPWTRASRDDAAMDIGAIGTSVSFYELIEIANREEPNSILLASIGTSLGEIPSLLAPFLNIFPEQKEHP